MRKWHRIQVNVVIALIVFCNLSLAAESYDFQSPYFKLSLPYDHPCFAYLSVDSLGKSKLDVNPMIAANDSSAKFTSRQEKDGICYYKNESDAKPAWQCIPHEKGFTLKSNYVADNVPWVFNIDQKTNHATCLGVIPEQRKIKVPCVMHFPGMGTFRITSKEGLLLDYDAQRRDCPTPFVRLSLPPADKDRQSVEYKFEVVAIYPKIKKIENDPRYDAFRRNFINIFQVNPVIMVLANNSSSDTCAFCYYEYSAMARHTPPLAEGLTALDLIGMTLERFFAGAKAYGITGYSYDIPATALTKWGTPFGSLDTLPSLVIAACDYYQGTKEKAWLNENVDKIIAWTDEMLLNDTDNDGLIEYGFSGNTNSWPGNPSVRPANWWDGIGFAHKDAYSNALAYKALCMMADLCKAAGKGDKGQHYKQAAAKLKGIYYKTFYNPDTGVLAGWKSADGQLHDYYFTFVNSIAVSYDLVEQKQANALMDAMLKKMKEAGFTNFELGLPGNLLPIKRGDYTHHDRRWGCNTSDELNDGFQIYENGGASACYVYFTIDALYKLGRKQDAEMILFPLLKSLDEGNFQGKCDNSSMTKDWKTWQGECWGYEGFLVDNYLTFLAVLSDR